MKGLFNEKKRLLKKLNKVTLLLDSEIEKRWGFNYSQTDNHECIDTLDSGTDNITYQYFIDIMNHYKKMQKKGTWTPNN